jgi:DNA invertase Pin-like site-specific DNA recombinase
MTEKPIWFLYARQSLSRQGDHGDSVSVADQFRSMEDHAAKLGAVVAGRYSDQDVSGSVESRDGLDQLMADARRVKPDAVVVRDISRLARDTRVFLTLIDALKKHNSVLLSATESLEDRTLTVVLSAFAERERLALAGRVAGGVREHARRGKTHGQVAFGYRRIDGEMLIHEPEAEVVRDIFRWFVGGLSMPMIAHRLNTEPGTLRPRAGGYWRRDYIAVMVRRPVYTGDVAIRARKDIAGRLWPAVMTRDAHPAIVDRATFESAQRRFQTQRVIVRDKIVSPFSGFALCAKCGGRIYFIEHERRERPGVMRRSVRCSSYSISANVGRIVAKPCPGTIGSREAHLVEAIATDALYALLGALATEAEIREQAAQSISAREDGGGDRAKRRLLDIERRRARLLEAYESGTLDLMTWAGRDRLLGAEMESLLEIVNAIPEPADVNAVVAMRDAFAALADDGVPLDMHALLTELDARILVDLDALTAVAVAGQPYAELFRRVAYVG